MNKKKVFVVVAVLAVTFFIFATIVMIAFNSVANNPIDKIAITYIRQNSDLQNKYGELIWIGRNSLHKYKAETEESFIKPTYTVEIETGRVMVWVTLKSIDGEWVPISLEEIEVIPNER